MSTAAKRESILIDEYLFGEQLSPVRHEYIDGVVYATAGANNRHNLIATNTLVALGIQLRGSHCRRPTSTTAYQRLRAVAGMLVRSGSRQRSDPLGIGTPARSATVGSKRRSVWSPLWCHAVFIGRSCILSPSSGSRSSSVG